MHGFTPTTQLRDFVLDFLVTKLPNSVNECQSCSAPTSPNVDNVNPAMADNETPRGWLIRAASSKAFADSGIGAVWKTRLPSRINGTTRSS